MWLCSCLIDLKESYWKHVFMRQKLMVCHYGIGYSYNFGPTALKHFLNCVSFLHECDSVHTYFFPFCQRNHLLSCDNCSSDCCLLHCHHELSPKYLEQLLKSLHQDFSFTSSTFMIWTCLWLELSSTSNISTSESKFSCATNFLFFKAVASSTLDMKIHVFYPHWILRMMLCSLHFHTLSLKAIAMCNELGLLGIVLLTIIQ